MKRLLAGALASLALGAAPPDLGAPFYDLFEVVQGLGGRELHHLGECPDLGTARDFVWYGAGRVVAYQVREVRP